MTNTQNYDLTLTHTAIKRAVKGGFDADTIKENFYHPVTVVASETHEGQFKVTGKALTIVGVFVSDDRFHGITLFKNKETKNV